MTVDFLIDRKIVIFKGENVLAPKKYYHAIFSSDVMYFVIFFCLGVSVEYRRQICRQFKLLKSSLL